MDHIFVGHMPVVPVCVDLGVLFFRKGILKHPYITKSVFRAFIFPKKYSWHSAILVFCGHTQKKINVGSGCEGSPLI